MFTGIITQTTSVKPAKLTKNGLKLTFKLPATWTDVEAGESINTNGACLTVEAVRKAEYDCFLVPETLAKTAFGNKVPKRVNLERALGVNDRLGGHFVQGHIDGIGTVSKIDKSDGWRLLIDLPEGFIGLVMPKGSITVDGVSLTVASLNRKSIGIALIPHTLEKTTLGDLKVGDQVNLESDMIGKYIDRILEARSKNAKSSNS